MWGIKAEYSETKRTADGVAYDLYFYEGDMTFEEAIDFTFNYLYAMRDHMNRQIVKLPEADGILFTYHIQAGGHFAELTCGCLDSDEQLLSGASVRMLFMFAVPQDCNFTPNVPPKGIRDGRLLCPGCEGTGRCDGCSGSGRVYYFGFGYDECVNCDGEGECTICDGTGFGD